MRPWVNSMNLLLRRPCSERHTGITDWILLKHWDKAHLCSFFHIHLTHNNDFHLMAPGDRSKRMDNKHRIQPCSDIKKKKKVDKLQ